MILHLFQINEKLNKHQKYQTTCSSQNFLTQNVRRTQQVRVRQNILLVGPSGQQEPVDKQQLRLHRRVCPHLPRPRQVVHFVRGRRVHLPRGVPGHCDVREAQGGAGRVGQGTVQGLFPV